MGRSNPLPYYVLGLTSYTATDVKLNQIFLPNGSIKPNIRIFLLGVFDVGFDSWSENSKSIILRKRNEKITQACYTDFDTFARFTVTINLSLVKFRPLIFDLLNYQTQYQKRIDGFMIVALSWTIGKNTYDPISVIHRKQRIIFLINAASHTRLWIRWGENK